MPDAVSSEVMRREGLTVAFRISPTTAASNLVAFLAPPSPETYLRQHG